MIRLLVKIEDCDKLIQNIPKASAKDSSESKKLNLKSSIKCGICLEELCTEEAGKICATQ